MYINLGRKLFKAPIPLPAHLFPFMNKKNNTNYCELLVVNVYGVRSESFT